MRRAARRRDCRLVTAGLLALIALLAVDAAAASAGDSVYGRTAAGRQAITVLDATRGQSIESRPAPEPHAADSQAADPDPLASPPAELGDGGAIPFRRAADDGDPAAAETGGAQPLVTVTSSLAIVLGLFAAVALLYRRTATASGGILPGEACVVLGKTPLGPRQNLTLVRVGQRVLVLAIGATSTTRLCELEDPDEVAHLTALCQAGGSRQAFHQTLRELGDQPPADDGFAPPTANKPRRGLFASG